MQVLTFVAAVFASAVAAQDYSVSAATTTTTAPSYVPPAQTYVAATQVTQLYSDASTVSAAAAVAAVVAMMI
ncbi:hypothetical protein BC830DRAFT_1123267 [Chytriomyces sp. MP71]|nr:hypothetical protein BC830DRAFT_1123267 [Chytriomyces sp. MP71]